MRMSIAKLRKIFPSGRADLMQAIVDHWDLAEDAGVSTVRIAATFLGNIGAETGGLRSIEENLNYSAKRMMQVWPSRIKTIAQAQKLAGKPEALANFVYARKDLGNTKPGDGWRFRGSGMLQTTGRSNFRRAGYEADPEGLREPDTAFAAACTFWRDHNLSVLAATGNEAAVRKVVNGGTNGLEEAKAYASKARSVLSAGEPVGLLTVPEATEVAPDPVEAAPGPPQATEVTTDPVAASSTLDDLRGKLASANDAVTQADLLKDSSIVRVGSRIVKGGAGLAGTVAVGAVGAGSADESQTWGQMFYGWLHAVPDWLWPTIIVAQVGLFVWYAHFNVRKRILMQKQGIVLPQAPK